MCSCFQSNHCSSSSSSCLDCKIAPAEPVNGTENKAAVKKRGVTWKRKLVDTDDDKTAITEQLKFSAHRTSCRCIKVEREDVQRNDFWGQSYARAAEVGASNAVGQI